MYRLLRFSVIGALTYIAIALALVAWPVPDATPQSGNASRQLERLVKGGTLTVPNEPQTFSARDGAKRVYRLYEGRGNDFLVFLHGSASDSRYLAQMARSLSAASGLTVATLDMRGHGSIPGRRGDVDHVAQQEQDIADLVTTFRTKKQFDRFLLGGHSIGGGLAIRYASGSQEPKPSGLILLAPYIHRKSPAARPDSGGWATPSVARFAGIDMLQRVGIRAFDGLPVLRFEVPPAAKDGTETPVYSWRLFASVTPRQDWAAEVARIACPVLVLAAERDPIFRSEGYVDVFSATKNVAIQIVPEIDHFQLSTSDEVPMRIRTWMKNSL